MSYAHHGCVLGAQSQVSFCRRVSDPFTLAYLPLFPPVTTELLCVSVSLCLSCSYVVFSFVSHVWVRSYGSQLYWAVIHIRGYVHTPQEHLVVGYSHSIVTQPPPQTSVKPQLHLARGRSHRSGDFVSNLPSSSDHLLPQDLPPFTLECLWGSQSSLVGARWPDLNPSFPGAYILYVFLNFTF